MVNYSSSNKTIFQIPTTSLKINGSNSRYPVGRVFCIGTNYQNHAVEMGSNLTSEPTFFMKPFNSVCQIDELTLPDNAKNVHHEVELVMTLVLKKQKQKDLVGFQEKFQKLIIKMENLNSPILVGIKLIL